MYFAEVVLTFQVGVANQPT